MSSSSAAPRINASPPPPAQAPQTFPPDLESYISDAVFRITRFLRESSHGETFSSDDIRKSLDVKLDGQSEDPVEAELYSRIVSNPHVRVMDGRFQFDHELSNVTSVLAHVESRPAGVRRETLLDFDSEGSRGWAKECAELLLRGKVMAVRHTQQKLVVMYPRGRKDFVVRLNAKVTGNYGATQLECSRDVRRQVRRGDLIIVDGKTYRVSGEFAGEAHTDWLTYLDAPYSTSSIREPHKGRKGEARTFSKEFTERFIPITPSFEGNVRDAAIFKHGCTNDVRKYWHDCCNDKSNIFADRALDRELIERGIMTEEKLAEYNHAAIDRQERRAKRESAAAAAGSQHKRRRTNRPMVWKSNVHMEDDGGGDDAS